jgi:MraZ protein
VAFRGQYEHSLDSKDRVTIPARFRSAMADGVVLAQGLDPCVEVYPLAAHAEVEERFLSGLDPFTREGRARQRRFHSRSTDETLDSAGRLRLPKRLVEYAGLDGPCVVAGVMNRLEIWNPQRWDEENERMDAELAEENGAAGEGAGAGGGE